MKCNFDNARNSSSLRKNVLVIDDDPLFRALIIGLLRDHCNVSTAEEGSDGFYHALIEPPDVVFLDVMMPGWDGMRTLEAFRSHSALSRVKIVMLTSDASRETVHRAIKFGADEYLLKSAISQEALQDCVDEPRFENTSSRRRAHTVT